MKDCFIEAGIIEDFEAEHRLSFVIKAVAVAHYQLSLDRNVTELQNDQDYFVADIDDISIGIAKIHAASTESFSTITRIFDDTTQGLLNVDIKFKDYLIENLTEFNIHIWHIDHLVQTFSENIKYGYDTDTQTGTTISQLNFNGIPIEFTNEDLNKIVLKPFMESIDEFVSKADENYGQYKLFLSGNYTVNTYFVRYLKATENIKYHHSIVKNSLVNVSSGVVSSRLNNYKSQTPLYLNDEHLSLFFDIKWSLPEAVLEKLIDDNNGNDAYDFIVGIDFGTSFSGCSYVRLKDKNGIPVTTEQIKAIRTGWPNYNEIAPTLLTYDRMMRSKYWGNEAKYESKKYKDFSIENFKLFLCPQYLDLDAVGVIADYLRCLNDHTLNELDRVSDLTKVRKMRYVITVPATWNLLAQDTMVQAAIEAGIILKDEIDQLHIISEPEAAVLCYKKELTEYFGKDKRKKGLTRYFGKDKRNKDLNFIVCDAGGGIVELTTFNLRLNKGEHDVPTTEPRICQIGDSISDICGSVCLDVRFKNYIFEFYKYFGININEEYVPLEDVMQDFVKNHKPNFRPGFRGSRYYDINLPGKGIENFTSNSIYKMSNGNMTLKMKNKDMKERIFDPVVNRIFALIDDQLKQAEKGGRTIEAILMVGGFSQSKYLQKRIKNLYKGVCDIKIPCDGVDQAISRGAVSYGLNPGILSRNTARQSFGLKVQAEFDKRLADSIKREMKGSDGNSDFEKECLEYFVTKGQELECKRQTMFKKDVCITYPNAAVIAIFACDSEEDANSRYLTKSHVKIMEAKIIMPYIVGIDGKLIHFIVSLQMEHIGVSITIECQDQIITAEVQRIAKNQWFSLKIESRYTINAMILKRPSVDIRKKTDYLFENLIAK
ncbi:uncharacterized protein EV154DRAFT_279403 [Mucor mucedo]|uniref:uncharacterized protein n=1 Tax=Mucor mucedo TaxID=29922 RepID=UPI00221EEBF9|nr:uncharacterized protein EV154DRAFT_279403 [Mucor mucedo]KAI7896055.1 hypothetical protein EV154DRAFT_279403 [Mucor mucedo]